MAIYDYLDKHTFFLACLVFGLFLVLDRRLDMLEFRHIRKMQVETMKAKAAKKKDEAGQR